MNNGNNILQQSTPLDTANKNRISVFAVMTMYFIMCSMLELMRAVLNYGLFDSLGNQMIDVIWSCFSQIIIFTLVPVLLYLFYFKEKKLKDRLSNTFTNLGLKKKVPLKVILLSIPAGLAMYFITIFVSFIFNVILVLIGYMPSTSAGTTSTEFSAVSFILSLVLTAVLPAIGEEITHRGMLVNAFKGWGDKQAIFWSALMFGLMHGNIQQVFYASLVLGIIGGIISVKTGSIVPGMILHFINNAISVVLSETSYYGGFGYNFQNFANNNAGLFLLLLIVACVLSIFYIIVYVHITVCSMRPKSENEVIIEQTEQERKEAIKKSWEIYYENLSKFYNNEQKPLDTPAQSGNGANNYANLQNSGQNNQFIPPNGINYQNDYWRQNPNYQPFNMPNGNYVNNNGYYNQWNMQPNYYSNNQVPNNGPFNYSPFNPYFYNPYNQMNFMDVFNEKQESKFIKCKKRMKIIMKENNAPEYCLTKADKLKCWIFIAGALAVNGLVTLYTLLIGMI